MNAPRRSELDEHAEAIRGLGRRVVRDVVEIGRRLTECKRIAGHGNWLPWLEREFGWVERTAQRLMNVYDLSERSDNLPDLNLPVSGLYLLAAPSTPVKAREDIIERAEAGERLTHAQINQTITDAKAPNPKPQPSSGQIAAADLLDVMGGFSQSLKNLDDVNIDAALGNLTQQQRPQVWEIIRRVLARLGALETRLLREAPDKSARHVGAQSSDWLIDALQPPSLAPQPSMPGLAAVDRCATCGQLVCEGELFGYRDGEVMRWYCQQHRLRQFSSDARTGAGGPPP